MARPARETSTRKTSPNRPKTAKGDRPRWFMKNPPAWLTRAAPPPNPATATPVTSPLCRGNHWIQVAMGTM